MVIFLFILLVCQAFFYLKIDRVIYGTYITPISALVLPYLLVLLAHILFHKALNFKEISPLSVLVWNIGTLLFWGMGLILAKLVLKKKVNNPFSGIRGIDIYIKGLHPILLGITGFFILIMFYSLYGSIVRLGFDKINSDDFAKLFAGGGVFGYSLIALRYILVYLIVVTSKKRTISNLFIFSIVLFSVLYQVKGWLLIPILAALLIRFIMLEQDKGKISKTFLKKIIYVLVIGSSFFTLFYYLSLGTKVRFQFIFTHFFHYLWSGLIGFSEYLNSDVALGEFTKEIFNPINNIINKITGKPMNSAINPYFFGTYEKYYKGSNVTTFFGSIIVSAGYLKSIVILCIFSIVSYGLFLKYVTNKTIFNLILYSFFLIGLFFGWFNFYFQHLIFYVIILITIFFNTFLLFSNKNNIVNSSSERNSFKNL